MSSAPQEEKFTVRSTIRHGMSWADHEDSPGWTARSPPKFSEEIPEITLDEVEYDRGEAAPKRTSSAATGSSTSQVAVFVGGLDYGLTSSELEAFFQSKGVKVSRVRVQKGVNGKSNGKAFLNVADRATLDQIVLLDGTQLSGRALMIKEDAGPPSKSSKPTTSKFGGKWRAEDKPANTSGWQAVKGGKVVDAPAIARKEKKPYKPVEKVEAVPETVPTERKPLNLKPRTKPVEVESSPAPAIFGGSKPRDEKPEEPVERQPEPQPVPVVAVQEEAPPAKKKTLKNRFAVFSSDEE